MSDKIKRYWLNVEVIEPGDIVLTRQQTRTSQKIRVRTNGEYSHAMLYLGNYSLLEAYAQNKRVRSQNTQRLHFDNLTSCIVLRLKRELDEIDAQNVVDSARTKVGTLYSSRAEFSKVIESVKHSALEPNRQFCSRLVAQSYNEAGFRIVSNPDYCSPADFERSEHLKLVADPLCEMSEEQFEFFSLPSRSLDEMERSTDVLLLSSMEIAGTDIPNINALTDYIKNNPQHDEAITKIAKESGYFEVWKIECEESPEFYDVDQFLSKYPNESERLEIAEALIAQEDNVVYHQRVTLAAFIGLNQDTPRKYFELLIENYTKLDKLSDTRKAVATKVRNSISDSF